jgi:hypothetical protein
MFVCVSVPSFVYGYECHDGVMKVFQTVDSRWQTANRYSPCMTQAPCFTLYSAVPTDARQKAADSSRQTEGSLTAGSRQQTVDSRQ